MGVGIQVKDLNAWYGKTQALYDINLHMQANHATALIGPSGCGKSTFIRCLNRMHETIQKRGSRAGYSLAISTLITGHLPRQIRRRVGMVFQQPNPFPTMSIYDNVVRPQAERISQS